MLSKYSVRVDFRTTSIENNPNCYDSGLRFAIVAVYNIFNYFNLPNKSY